MSKIKNIMELRDHSIEVLEKLRQGKIDIDEASINAKICEGIISSLKIELEYHKMLEQKPIIKFLEGSQLIFDNKKLLEKKD